MDVTRFLGAHRFAWLVVGSLPLLGKAELDARMFRRVFMNINLFALLLTAAVILDPFFGR